MKQEALYLCGTCAVGALALRRTHVNTNFWAPQAIHTEPGLTLIDWGGDEIYFRYPLKHLTRCEPAVQLGPSYVDFSAVWLFGFAKARYPSFIHLNTHWWRSYQAMHCFFTSIRETRVQCLAHSHWHWRSFTFWHKKKLFIIKKQLI